MADAPHILDQVGREAFRRQLISDIRKKGGDISDSATIEDCRCFDFTKTNVAVHEQPETITLRRRGRPRITRKDFE